MKLEKFSENVLSVQSVVKAGPSLCNFSGFRGGERSPGFAGAAAGSDILNK